MPLYLDRHELEGATPEAVAAAHMLDLGSEEGHGVHFITYWFEPESQKAFCLCDAPSADAVSRIHAEAHGMLPNRVIEVDHNAVRSFLGAILEPAPGEPWVASGFRTIVFTDIVGSTELTNRIGDERAMEVIRQHDAIVRRALSVYGGREVKHTGDGMMASFDSAPRAVECAVSIQKAMIHHNSEARTPFELRVGLSAGEPVAENGDLFGAAVQLAARICSTCEPARIFCSSAVRELCLGKGFLFGDRGRFELKGVPDPVHVFEVLTEL